MKKDTIKVPISMKKNLITGETSYNYQDVPTETYIAWLKRCYDLSGKRLVAHP